MQKVLAPELSIPLTVPSEKRTLYKERYLKATKGTQRIFLFAGDQKIEHLNKDFFSYASLAKQPTEEAEKQTDDPSHLFQIASQAPISFFAAQLGLIAQYGQEFSGIDYLVKLNSKTDLVTIEQDDPFSALLTSVNQVIRFQDQSGLSIIGVGYTIYLGSRYEAQMLAQAAQIIIEAHQAGLLVVLWIYPRGKAVKNERSAEIIAGAAGVALCLGADFVKVNPPEPTQDFDGAFLLGQATRAAGKTGVLCSGGSLKEPALFLKELYLQLHTGNTRGAAIGRNIHQKTLSEALAFSHAIAKLVFENASLEEALAEIRS